MALNLAHVDVARLKGKVKEKVKAKAKENVRRTPFFFLGGFGRRAPTFLLDQRNGCGDFGFGRWGDLLILWQEARLKNNLDLKGSFFPCLYLYRFAKRIFGYPTEYLLACRPVSFVWMKWNVCAKMSYTSSFLKPLYHFKLISNSPYISRTSHVHHPRLVATSAKERDKGKSASKGAFEWSSSMGPLFLCVPKRLISHRIFLGR